MEQQTIFFKEISKLNLFDLKSENRIDLAKNFRLKLVANSNKFGIVAFGFNNVIKIYNTNEFESVSDNQVPNHIATVNLEQGNKFVHIEFNSTQTHLIALVINFKKEKNFEYFLNVYAMESIKVDVYNSQQSPVLLNRIALENDNSRINDLLVSPKDDDLVILSKENGKIEIISKILDQNYKINSKQMNSLCICWSPTGKNFAYCSKDKRLSLNSLDFAIKYEYQCLENDLEPNCIKWLAKKEFLVSYNDAENNPRIFYHEIIKNQNANETLSKEELDGAVFATGEQNDISWINFKNINEYNLILCAYSKCPEIGVLVKDKNSKYQLLYLEEFRPNLPMSSNANDVFPIGIEISFNSQKEIDFDTRGKQPPSPLLFCLADTGFLSTFYVINVTLSDKKVCKAAEKLPYTQIKAPLLPTPEPNISVSQIESILSPINSQAPFRFKQNEQKTTDPTVRTFQITSESKENVPSQSINLLPKAPLINQQQAPNNLPNFEQSKENVPSQSINLLSKAPLINQQQAPNNLPNFEQSKQNLPSQTIQLPDPCICKHAIRVKINKKNGEIINRTTILKSLISLDAELTESIDTVTTIGKNIWFVSFKESFDYKVLIGKCLPINEHIVSIENAEEPLKNEKIFTFKFYGLKPNFDKYLIEKHLISEGALPMEIVNIYDEFMSDAEFRHIKTGTVRANLKFNSAQNPKYYEIVKKIPKNAYIQGHPVSIERVGESRCRFCQSTEHKVVQCKFKCVKCNGRGHTAPECNLARRIAKSNNDHQFDDDEGVEISVVDEIDPQINKITTQSNDLNNKNDQNTQMMANVDTNDEEVNYQSRQLEKIFSTKPANLPSQFKSNIGIDADKQSEKKENFGIEQSKDIKQQDAKEKDVKLTESSDSKSAETDKKNELNSVSASIPSFQSENLTKSDINSDKKEDKKKDTNLFGLLQGNKPPVFDKSSFSSSVSSQFSFNLNQAKGKDQTDTNAENTKPVVEEPKNEKASVQEMPLFGSKKNFLNEKKSADQTKEPAKKNEFTKNLFTSFPPFGQPAAFGGPGTFGAPSAFGANSTFGSTSTPANTPASAALSSGTGNSTCVRKNYVRRQIYFRKD